MKNLADELLLQLLIKIKKKDNRSIYLIPVFHVEKLYIDDYFNNLLAFCKSYHSITGVRPVLTCMTPYSPILALSLKKNNFSHEVYWERIQSLKNYGIIGLHGHFVRRIENDIAHPMHSFCFDIETIKKQLEVELNSLIEKKLVEDNNLIYSGGWWFTSNSLRAFLTEIGFEWDFTLSSSQFNISQGSESLDVHEHDGILIQKFDGKALRSPIAVSSIAAPLRPLSPIIHIIRQYRKQRDKEITLSLYSHDYDLNLEASLKFVSKMHSLGFKFIEPSI